MNRNQAILVNRIELEKAIDGGLYGHHTATGAGKNCRSMVNPQTCDKSASLFVLDRGGYHNGWEQISAVRM